MGERRLCKADVRGSSPLISTGSVARIDDGFVEEYFLLIPLQVYRRDGPKRPGEMPGRFVSFTNQPVVHR